MSTASQPLSILLVEDNPIDVALVKGQLAQSGISLTLKAETTLAAAVQQLKRRQKFDVVLLDLTLPDSQGLETFGRAHTFANQTPIVVLTGVEDMELGIQALSDGAQDYLLKSKIDADSLIRAIRYAVERARRQRAESELTAAGAIQRRLFPRAAPKVPGFDVSGRCTQATYAGGDFFDFFLMGSNQLGVVIADAAGHGIGPAITMSETRAVIRAFASVTDDVGEILTRAGAILARDLTKETFVALFLGQIDVASRSLEFATAGHPGFILTSAGRAKQLLKSVDPPLGIDRGVQYRTSRDIQLDPGDSLFLFTDGFADTVDPDGASFGKQRVFEAVRQRYQNGAANMLDHLFDQLKAFRRGAHSEGDITAVVVKASPPVQAGPAPSASEPESESRLPVEAREECQHFDVEQKNDVAIVRIHEKKILSAQKCAEMKDELVRFIQSRETSRIVLCFDAVDRFSSEGINICYHAKSALDSKHGQLRLSGMQPQIREAFAALNLDGTVFEIHDDIATALNSFEHRRKDTT